jgi:hypothetical protein
VRLAGGRNGAGVGPFGSGFGRIGAVGAAVALGTLTAPAAGPGALGLLAGIPTLAAGGAGALGTLALAFAGVGKAIDGDLKAFKALQPAQQQFVLTVRSLSGWLDKLKETAGISLFPGLTAGLKSALSPGTVGAITAAVKEFGTAIGNAGAAWGKYFGSAEFQSIFGPLMATGARNLSKFSDAAMHLFDALGVLGRSAIPLVNWLTDLTDRGSHLVDTWLHAKDATGGLSRAMNEAKSSLRLVGGLALSLLNVVGALGKALYPVSKIAVKDLTDGLNALARMIQRNQQGIRNIVNGALAALVSAVKTSAPIVRGLAKGLSAVVHSIGGWKTAFEIVIGGLLAAKFVGLAKSVLGVVTAVKEARLGMLALGGPEVLAALAAAAVAFHEVSDPKSALNRAIHDSTANAPHDPIYKGGKWVNPDSGKAIADQAYWSSEFRKNHPAGTVPAEGQTAYGTGSATGQHGALTTNAQRKADQASANPRTTPRTETPVDSSSVFGTPPPFTKNVPAPKKPKVPPLLPALASRAEALASANANRASLLHNTGATAQRYLKNELADLETADKSIKAKYATATGKIRTELFTAITGVENKMRTVRQRIASAIKSSRAAELQFAVDNAKAALAATTKGTAAYDKAAKAEEKALRAQISYLEKTAHNSKLSLSARSKALRAITADEKTLAALLKPAVAANTRADQAQFLSDFQHIVTAFAPNAVPLPSGKTDTHLYDIKSELRQQTPLLKRAVSASRFPASGFGLDAVGALG